MKICEGVHQLRIDFNVTPEIKRYVYIYIIQGKEQFYLIDTGVKGSDVKIEEYIHNIGKISNNINAVLLTHSHPDHIGALKSIQERYRCCVYAGEGERAWIEDVDLQYKERPIPGFYELVEGSVLVDRILTDGCTICLEPGITIEVMGTPGHSKGSLCFYFKEKQILFTGDAIPEPEDALVYESSLDSENSLKRLDLLDGISIYCPAWDKVYDSQGGRKAVRKGLSRISKIRECLNTCRIKNSEDDPSEIFSCICKACGMEEYRNTPLFKRSVMSDLRQ